MLPKYQDQDTVIIRLQSECETGQDCAVFVNGNDLTLLKVVKQIDGILLQPFNPNYDPKFYPYDHNNESVKILGVIVEMRRKFI
ncbi:LexA repressor [bioreactor metagenome]|uniref:LexA repressor n=1 Tax=bioreactor metagenome TaxID=1076179 RepID=A0A645CS19_9ZZZZ